MILDSIVVSISACHADDPGSIPGREVLLPFFLCSLKSIELNPHDGVMSESFLFIKKGKETHDGSISEFFFCEGI